MRKISPLEHLETNTLDHLEWHAILPYYACQAQTGPGRQRLLTPQPQTAQALRERAPILKTWLDRVSGQGPLRIPDLRDAKWFERDPFQNPFSAEDLSLVGKFLVFMIDHLETNQFAFLPEAPKPEPSHLRLRDHLKILFEPNGDWSPLASPKLGQLLNTLRHLESQIERNLQSHLERHGDILSESIVYERNGRKCLAVKTDFKGRIRGIVQDSSASGKTVFLEPESVLGPQNEWAETQAAIREEIWRIRCETTQSILDPQLEIVAWMACCARWDAEQTLALVAHQTGSHFLIPEGKDLHLIRARHPYLDEKFAALRQRASQSEGLDAHHMVPFSLRLDDQVRGLVLSGANTGGKTVCLKTTGLLAQLARCGLPVPCEEGSQIPYYRYILADIGDHQSLTMSLSTFASHLEYLKAILAADDPATLVLLDELGSGTDPEEGSALARALIETMLQRDYQFLVTTHMQVLCTFALTHPHLDNGSMVFDERALRPTYQFAQGVPGRSHALEIARRSGLDESVLTRAQELISANLVDIQAAIRELQERSRSMEKAQRKLRKEEIRLHRKIQETKAETRKLESARQQVQQEAQSKIRKEVERAEMRLRTFLEETKAKSLRKQAGLEFAKLSQDLVPETHAVQKVEIQASGTPLDAWQKGDLLYYLAWGKTAKLVRLDRKKVHIEIEGKQLIVEASDVLHQHSGQKEKPVRTESEFEPQMAQIQLRLLGMTVEEAIADLEVTLDRVLRSGQPYLEIIHGHGTGALKQAIRTYLKRHPVREQWQVEIDPGNDGITQLRFV
ncbi:MAG: Smr/MutS family protein [Acidobacteria bacterium]|nr:Smr/MutS family protein [Acidobacteriota bacterium]MCB9397414.1 Smr/MutS family protein [Acidobacteriota bacterium]